MRSRALAPTVAANAGDLDLGLTGFGNGVLGSGVERSVEDMNCGVRSAPPLLPCIVERPRTRRDRQDILAAVLHDTYGANAVTAVPDTAAVAFGGTPSLCGPSAGKTMLSRGAYM